MDPTTIVSLLRERRENPPTCPMTYKPFVHPWILVEDGFTYEKSAIEARLKKCPNQSPMAGDIPSATLLPNFGVHSFPPTCPITKEPFKKPYYCIEDGQTYEKEAIIEWFKTKIKEFLRKEDYTPRDQVTSPATGIPMTSLTLVPNKIFFKGGILDKQTTEVFILDPKELLPEKKNITCIYDNGLRDLVCKYLRPENSKRRDQISLEINEAREKLGLKTHAISEKFPDFSHLDLSNLHFKDAQLKGAVFKQVDFSASIFDHCQLGRSRFLDCPLQATQFLNCKLLGERVSFYGSDLEEAKFHNCQLEKGSTWKVIQTWDNFKLELANRGGLNTDSVSGAI